MADRWGRKPLVYLSMLGILLGEVWVRIVCKLVKLFSRCFTDLLTT